MTNSTKEMEPSTLVNCKVSIIIAAFNAESTIKRALLSCISQTHTNLEIIVVNDGSTDSTLEILKSYLREEPRLILLNQVENSGQGAARNRAIGVATGSYVTIMDADDELHPLFVERLLENSIDSLADITRCEFFIINKQKGTKAPLSHLKPGYTGFVSDRQRKQLLAKPYFTVAKLYSTEFLRANSIRFGEGYIYEDVEFYFGAMTKAAHIYSISVPLYSIHVHSESTTRTGFKSDKHQRSFLSAVDNSLAKWGHKNLLMPSFVTYILTRFELYAGGLRRIPFRLWLQTASQLLGTIGKRPEPVIDNSTPKRLRKIILINEHSNLAASIALIISSVLRRPVEKLKTIFKKLRFLASKKMSHVFKRVSLHILKLVISPRKNKVFLHGFDGAVRGNTLAILPKLRALGFECTVLTEGTLPRGLSEIRTVRPYSLSHYYWALCSRIHVLESWSNLSVPKIKGSVWVQMWHGTPCKKMLLDTHEEDVLAKRPRHLENKLRDICRWDYLIAQNEFCKEKFVSAFAFTPTNVPVLGYPRNDSEVAGIKRKIYSKYKIPQHKKLLVYAPTWRDHNQFAEEMDFNYLLDWNKIVQRLEEYVLLFAGHPYSNYSEDIGNGVIESSEPDVQDLLIASDALITDYSSCFFDYLNSGKPFCLLWKDFERYKRSRGVYSEVENDFREFIARKDEQVPEILLSKNRGRGITNLSKYAEPEGSASRKLALFLRAL